MRNYAANHPHPVPSAKTETRQTVVAAAFLLAVLDIPTPQLTGCR